MIGRRLVGALGVALLLGGCGGGAGGADAAHEAGGAPDSAVPDGATDASADVAASCTTLVADGALTVTTAVTPTFPPPETPAGGTIASGVYFQTAKTLHVPSTCNVLPGAPTATAVRFTATSPTAGTLEAAQEVTVPGEHHLFVASYSYTIAGTTMTRTLRCYNLDGVDGSTLDGGVRVGDVTSASYTATPTEVRLYAPLGSTVDAGAGSCGTELTVHQKQ